MQFKVDRAAVRKARRIRYIEIRHCKLESSTRSETASVWATTDINEGNPIEGKDKRRSKSPDVVSIPHKSHQYKAVISQSALLHINAFGRGVLGKIHTHHIEPPHDWN